MFQCQYWAIFFAIPKKWGSAEKDVIKFERAQIKKDTGFKDAGTEIFMKFARECDSGPDCWSHLSQSLNLSHHGESLSMVARWKWNEVAGKGEEDEKKQPP